MKKQPIAIITARGGSKRIPKKNIKDFLGFPIIKYSIDAAMQSNLFQKVIVSTDDPEIAEISKKYGAQVPFYRSQKNSGDFAVISDVIFEVEEMLAELGFESETFCCMTPTAPFITSHNLIETWSTFSSSGVDFLFPVCQYSYPPQRAVKILNSRIMMIQPEHLKTRSQDLEPIYHDAGQYYWGRFKSLRKYGSFLLGNVSPVVISDLMCQDIDTVSDWEIAELKFGILKNSREKNFHK